MHFDPFFSPLPAVSPPSAPSASPPTAPPIDWQRLAAQKQAMNDSLRGEKAALIRSLAEANKTISRLNAALLSRPSPSPASSSSTREKETVGMKAAADASHPSSSSKRKIYFGGYEEEKGHKKAKTSSFASFASPGPSPFAAASGSPFGAPSPSSFGSGGSFATGGFLGPLQTPFPTLVTKWANSFTKFFENHTPDSTFPTPPTSQCTTSHCAASNTGRALEACPHAVERALKILIAREEQNGGKEGRKAWFKKMRSWWHPDRVGTLAGKEKKAEWQDMAKEVFTELGGLMEEIEKKEMEEGKK